MKNKIVVTLVAALATVGLSHGAITIGFKNFSSNSVGVPIVDANGAPTATSSLIVSAGIFTTLPDFATASASQIIAAFTALDSTPVTSSSTLTGLFTGNDTTTLTAYPTGFEGANAYFVVGNGTSLATSTKIAVYHTSGQVYTSMVAGIASVQMVASSTAGWVYGTLTPVTSQSTISGSAFTTGIQLTSVPEPSAALLGLLGVFGLARRRR